MNPLDFIIGKGWRRGKVRNWNSTKEKLYKYPWSSLKSFIDNNHQDPIISGLEVITSQFNKKTTYESYMRGWSDDLLLETKDFIF